MDEREQRIERKWGGWAAIVGGILLVVAGMAELIDERGSATHTASYLAHVLWGLFGGIRRGIRTLRR